MITVQPMKRDSKTEDRFSRANSRRVFQAFPTNSKYAIPSSSSSESSKTSASSKKANSQQVTTRPNFSGSTVAKPNRPLTNSTLPVTCNNEVVVFDVNDTAALHSLIARNGAWFLDVNDLDAMDKESTFQYVAIRPSPHSELVLTRVPELRHLIYAKFDEEGRPYPVQMRKVSKAKYLARTEETMTEEESKEFQANNSSFWEALSITLRRSIMFNEVVNNEEPQSNEEKPQDDA